MVVAPNWRPPRGLVNKSPLSTMEATMPAIAKDTKAREDGTVAHAQFSVVVSDADAV